jgi:hypothetical protein
MASSKAMDMSFHSRTAIWQGRLTPAPGPGVSPDVRNVAVFRKGTYALREEVLQGLKPLIQNCIATLAQSSEHSHGSR